LDLFSYSALFAFFQVLVINIVLSGDNAVVIGMVAARVAPNNRHKVILWGMVAAVLLRIVLSIFAVRLLAILGLLLAGGIILLWVAWRLYRDIREEREERAALAVIAADRAERTHSQQTAPSAVPLGRAIFQIAVADISMSVDNVLAIAAAMLAIILLLAGCLVGSLRPFALIAALVLTGACTAFPLMLRLCDQAWVARKQSTTSTLLPENQ